MSTSNETEQQEQIAGRQECICHKFIRLRDGQCPVHGFVQKQTGEGLTAEQIKEFQQAIGRAAWKLDLEKFGDAIGASPEHDYTRDKFKQLTALNKALSQFDPDTLLLIIEGGRTA